MTYGLYLQQMIYLLRRQFPWLQAGRFFFFIWPETQTLNLCSKALKADIAGLLGISYKVVGCSMEECFLCSWTKYSLRPTGKISQDLSHVLHKEDQLLPSGKHN